MSTDKLQRSYDDIMKAARRARSSGKTPDWLSDKQKEAVEDLRRDFPRGSTVFMVLRKRSSSGTKSVYGIIAIKKDGGRMYALHPNYNVGLVTGLTVERTPGGTDGIVMKGGGYNKADSIADELSHALYGEGRQLKAEVL
jgi:hypothetical protein